MRCLASAVTTGPISDSGSVAGPIFMHADRGRERLDQPVGRLLADRHRDRDRHAALAGRAVARAHQRVDGLVHVGVRHDDHVVLGAAQRLHALARRASPAVDVLGDRRRADEAHRLDVGMVEDRVDRFLVAVDDVEHAGREAGLLEQLPDQHRCRRIALRRLQDEGVAAGDGDRIHPHRHHGREVERRDAGDDAERLAVGPAVDLGADIAAVLALQEMRDAAGEIDDVDAARRARPARRRASCRARREIVRAISSAFRSSSSLKRNIVLDALERRRRAPAGGRLLGGGDGGIHLRRGRERQLGRLLAGRGIEDGRQAPRRGRDLAAVDGVLDGVHGSARYRSLNAPS